MKNTIATTALAAATLATTLAASSVIPVYAADKEKCYGVSLAGQNDCANLAGTHSCAAQATVNNDIGEWKLVETGTCKSLGGYSKAEALKIYNAES